MAAPATVTWTINDATGAVVATLLDAAPTAAGTVTRSYDGRRTDGTRLPVGAYTSVVTATDDATTASQAVGFTMNAFGIKPSDATPKRGQKITVTVTSAEQLSTKPRLYIKQPGRATWSVAMTKVGRLRVQGDHHAQVGFGRDGHLQGEGQRQGWAQPEDQQGVPDPLTSRLRVGLPDPSRDRTGPHTATPYRYSPGPSSRCRRLHTGTTVDAPAAG